MTRLEFTGHAVIPDEAFWDCVRDLNNVLAKYAAPGSYSLDPSRSAVSPEEVKA